MTGTVLVSICIPTYNQRPDFLRAAVRSALAQTYTPIEVVVSDNHSTMDVAAVLADFSDPRLRICRPPQHVSMSANFAFAASQSRGEFLAFLSSDDLLHPECCDRLVAVLQTHPAVAFAYGAIYQIDETGKIIACQRKSHLSFVRSGQHEFQRYVWAGGTWIIGGLVRRSAYEAAGGFGEGFDEVGDWYLALRLLTVGDVAYTDVVLASVRIWTNNERRSRLVGMTQDIRHLYDWLASPAMLSHVNGGVNVLARARRRWAINISVHLSAHHISADEKSRIHHETRLLDQGRIVRMCLWLSDTPLAPLLINGLELVDRLRALAVRLIHWLRQQIWNQLVQRSRSQRS